MTNQKQLDIFGNEIIVKAAAKIEKKEVNQLSFELNLEFTFKSKNPKTGKKEIFIQSNLFN